MQGASRAAAAAGQQALDEVFAVPASLREDTWALAEDLFGVGRALDSSASLRRALTDPTRDAAAKGELVHRLFGAKTSAKASIPIVATLAGQRWSAERDLGDTLETLAVQALVARAEHEGRLDGIEDELFRFERIVAGDPALRAALTDRRSDPQARAALVARLLEGKAQAETVRLARQAVLAPRGRRFDRVVERFLQVLTQRREQLSATVTTAVELDASQRERLAAALASLYGTRVHLNVVLDPRVIGGIRVQIGDEVVDGTVLRRLDEARRHLGV